MERPPYTTSVSQNMDKIAQEILVLIAYKLPTIDDIRRFRLVCRALSFAGFDVLFRRVSVLNTAENVKHFQEVMRIKAPHQVLLNTRHLTIYHGTWPLVNSRKDWLQHCLRLHRSNQHAPNAAFGHYKRFVSSQENGPGCEARILTLFTSLPKLQSVSLSHVNTWSHTPFNNIHFEKLLDRILILPFWGSFVAQPLSGILAHLNKFPNIKRLNIHGTLLPEQTEGTYDGITHLEVRSIIRRSESATRNFLLSFPSLRSLELQMDSCYAVEEHTLSLQHLHWPQLRICTLVDLCTTEDELFTFIQQHGKLRLVLLNYVTLTQGSWGSLLARSGAMEKAPMIIADFM